MTGPAVPSDEELRELLIDALDAFEGEMGAGIPPEETADALLPVVRRWADQRAAGELRAAAASPMNGSGGRPLGWLLTRADALTREATS